MNICGCLVHALPGTTERVADAMTRVDGVEVHAQTEDNRIVVVVEDSGDKLASDIIMDLHQIPGVISLTLTYHHFEDQQGGGASQPQPVATCAN